MAQIDSEKLANSLLNFPSDFKVTLQAVPTSELPNGVVINLPEINKSGYLVDLLEDMPDTAIVPILGGSDNNTIANIFDYIGLLLKNPIPEKKSNEQGKRAPLQPWEVELFDKLQSYGMQHIFNFLMAANMLQVNDAIDASTYHIANNIKGKQPDEIRKKFLIE